MAAAGNARSIVIKMGAAAGLIVAVIGGLIAYGLLADDSTTASFESRAAAGGGAAGPPTPEIASLWVNVPPADAQVLIDGETAGTVPLWLDSVSTGQRRIQVLRPDGAVVLDTTLVAEAGATIEIETASGSGGPDAIAANATPPDLEAEPLDVPPSTSEAATPEPAPPPTAARVGDLRVTSSPSGAAVVLDGRRVGTTPFAMGGLAPGTYTVTVGRRGYQTAARRIEVRAGGLSESVVNLLPVDAEPAEAAPTAEAATGTVEILVRPWGQIDIDGTTHQRETDVVYRTSLTAGSHRVRVSHPQLGSAERTVTIRPGERERIEFDLTGAN